MLAGEMHFLRLLTRFIRISVRFGIVEKEKWQENLLSSFNGGLCYVKLYCFKEERLILIIFAKLLGSMDLL